MLYQLSYASDAETPRPVGVDCQPHIRLAGRGPGSFVKNDNKADDDDDDG